MAGPSVLFLITPFSPRSASGEDPGLFEAVQNTIKSVAADGGYALRNPMTMWEAGRIMPQVETEIREADLVLAIVTPGNLNVTFEVGFAHAVARRAPLLVWRNGWQPPFDIRDMRGCIYGDRDSLDEFRAGLTAAIRDNLQVLPRPESTIPTKDSDAPPIAPAYIDRPGYKAVLWSMLSQSELPKMRVMVGPSASGKTSLAAGFFAELRTAYGEQDSKWIDCRLVFERPRNLSSCRLVVLDNLSEMHVSLRENWFSQLRQALTVVTTRDADVAKAVQTLTGTFDIPATLVSVQYFDEAEVSSFFRKTVPPELYEEAVFQAADLQGQPLGLQLLREVLLFSVKSNSRTSASTLEDSPSFGKSPRLRVREGLMDWSSRFFAEQPSANFSGEASNERAEYTTGAPNISKLLNQWLQVRDENGLMGRILRVLAQVPFAGMDREALSEVLDRGHPNLDEPVKKLRSVGLVTEVAMSPVAQQRGNLLMVHEQVRQVEASVDVDEIYELRERYVNLLERRLKDRVGESHGVLTCVDAWLSAWSYVFDFSRGGLDDARYRRLQGLLQTLTRGAPACWENALRAVPDFVRTQFQDPGKENCAVVIGVANMVRRLDGNKQLAELMCAGAMNNDLWARAASLTAATRQWEKLGSSFRAGGLDHLQRWVEFAYQSAERENGFGDSHWRNELDLDFLAVTTGIVRLDNINGALKVVQNPSFERRFPHTTLTHLALIVALARNGILASSRAGEFHSLINGWTTKLSLAPQRTQETAARVGDYLRSAHKQQFRTFDSALRPARAATFALDIARCIGDEALATFVKNEEHEPRTHI